MKKKDIYFLFGVGMGVILTSIIFYMGLLVNPSVETYKEPSRDEIILLARDIGMTFPEDNELTEENNTNNEIIEEDTNEDLPFINVQPDEVEQIDENSKDENEQNELEEVEVNEGDNDVNGTNDILDNDNNNEDVVVENITFTITPGESSNDVCRDLFQLGLIDDEKEFNDFLVRKNLDRVIRPKKYTVPSTITKSEIVLLITGKNVKYE